MTKAFEYEEKDGQVQQIRSANTSKFLRIGELPSGSDRSVSREALETVERAFRWSEELRERDKAKK
jgi:hypothetical protein